MIFRRLNPPLTVRAVFQDMSAGQLSNNYHVKTNLKDCEAEGQRASAKTYKYHPTGSSGVLMPHRILVRAT